VASCAAYWEEDMPDWLNPRDLSLAPLDWIRCGNTFLPIPMVPVPIPKGEWRADDVHARPVIMLAASSVTLAACLAWSHFADFPQWGLPPFFPLGLPKTFAMFFGAFPRLRQPLSNLAATSDLVQALAISVCSALPCMAAGDRGGCLFVEGVMPVASLTRSGAKPVMLMPMPGIKMVSTCQHWHVPRVRRACSAVC